MPKKFNIIVSILLSYGEKKICKKWFANVSTFSCSDCAQVSLAVFFEEVGIVSFEIKSSKNKLNKKCLKILLRVF